MTKWENFIFLIQLYTKEEETYTSKTLWHSYNLSVFCTLHFYCQCPWLNINFFLVKGNHLAFFPTMIEAWCTCRFQPCRNAAKPQRPCQTGFWFPTAGHLGSHSVSCEWIPVGTCRWWEVDRSVVLCLWQLPQGLSSSRYK
jgi:hypothetical protein